MWVYVYVCDGTSQSFITGSSGFCTSNSAKEYTSKMGMPVKLTCYAQHKN